MKKIKNMSTKELRDQPHFYTVYKPNHELVEAAYEKLGVTGLRLLSMPDILLSVVYCRRNSGLTADFEWPEYFGFAVGELSRRRYAQSESDQKMREGELWEIVTGDARYDAHN